MPSCAEIRDASATEPNHWGGGMDKQEEAVKKKSFNCGLEKKNTSPGDLFWMAERLCLWEQGIRH